MKISKLSASYMSEPHSTSPPKKKKQQQRHTKRRKKRRKKRKKSCKHFVIIAIVIITLVIFKNIGENHNKYLEERFHNSNKKPLLFTTMNHLTCQVLL